MGASCNPSFTSGFESGFSGWKTDTCCQHSLKTVSSPRREGNRAAQFTLSKNDPDVAGSKRAEIGLNYVPANSEWTYRRHFRICSGQSERESIISIQLGRGASSQS